MMKKMMMKKMRREAGKVPEGPRVGKRRRGVTWSWWGCACRVSSTLPQGFPTSPHHSPSVTVYAGRKLHVSYEKGTNILYYSSDIDWSINFSLILALKKITYIA